MRQGKTNRGGIAGLQCGWGLHLQLGGDQHSGNREKTRRPIAALTTRDPELAEDVQPVKDAVCDTNAGPWRPNRAGQLPRRPQVYGDDQANQDRYGAPIEALDKAGKSGSAESLADGEVEA
jgi:hypothetical protein